MSDLQILALSFWLGSLIGTAGLLLAADYLWGRPNRHEQQTGRR